MFTKLSYPRNVSLDSQITFGVGGINRQWPYQKFYNIILVVLNDAPANILEDIIKHLSSHCRLGTYRSCSQVFKGGLYEIDEDDDEFITVSSLVAQMWVQVAKDHERQASQ